MTAMTPEEAFIIGSRPLMTPAQQDERLRNILFNEGPYARVKVDEIIGYSQDIQDGINELLKRIDVRSEVK